MNNRKVGIIGVGAVGATAAYSLSMLGLCNEIILFDINNGVAKGKCIDISQANYYASNETIISTVDNLSYMKNCDIVIVTAGLPRKEGMTRDDLLMVNGNIVKEISLKLKNSSPDAIIISVTNPLDIMTFAMQKFINCDRKKIIGLGGALDGSRMAYQIQQKTSYSLRQMGSLVIGDHGENMIPLPQKTSISDIPLTNYVSSDNMKNIIDKTKNGGAEIVSHLGTSGYYGPGRAIAYMVECILNNSKAIVPCSVILNGEYGYKDVSIGVPVVLGENGIEKIIELDLDINTRHLFDKSIVSVKKGIKLLYDNNIFN